MLNKIYRKWRNLDKQEKFFALAVLLWIIFTTAGLVLTDIYLRPEVTYNYSDYNYVPQGSDNK